MPRPMPTHLSSSSLHTQFLLSLFAILAFIDNQVIMFSLDQHSHAKLLALATTGAGTFCVMEMLRNGCTRGQLLLFVLSTSAFVNSQVIMYFPGELRVVKAVLGVVTAVAGCLSELEMLKEVGVDKGVKED